MINLLSINNLVGYATQRKVKKLRKKDIKENLLNSIQDQFDDSLVYEKGTTEVDISNDIMMKWTIINSLTDTTQKIIQGHGKTTYEIWENLKESFTTSIESRKELKRKLNEIKFDEDKVINIFMIELQNLIYELEKIDSDLADNIKEGLLNRALTNQLQPILLVYMGIITIIMIKKDLNDFKQDEIIRGLMTDYNDPQ